MESTPYRPILEHVSFSWLGKIYNPHMFSISLGPLQLAGNQIKQTFNFDWTWTLVSGKQTSSHVSGTDLHKL